MKFFKYCAGEKIRGEVPTLKLAINGKFLGQVSGRSGVYRVAYEMVLAIDKLLSKDAGLAQRITCCILLPLDNFSDLKLQNVELIASGPWSAALDSRLWEQFVLPWAAKGHVLLNLCNLGPTIYKNAYTMMHDAQVRASPGSYSLTFRLWYQLIQPRLAKVNRGVLTVSQFSREQLDRYGIVPASRVRVIHNGCDHVLRHGADETMVERAGLTSKTYVVALANTQRHKNIGILFKAFEAESMRDITLALFGSAIREDFEKLGYHVPSNVKFVGRISDEELSGLLGEAIALAFPSLTEGFGLPPLEAMLLGCPVVAAPCGALVEVCGDAVLWANPHVASEWASQIAYLHADSGRAGRIANTGRLHAASYTWENAARRLLTMMLEDSANDLELESGGHSNGNEISGDRQLSKKW
ncbi:MAG: glycosyltransferase family 4 protein [Janthinobacterium lividum]